MTKMIKMAGMGIIAAAAVAAGAYRWHAGEMSSLSRQLQEEQARKEQMARRIQDIQGKLDGAESANESLLQQIDDLLAEEVAVFGAEAVMEEIQGIGELAAVEYHYTNVGTLDAVDVFKLTKWEKPFSRKSAVVTMDGVLKAGVDVSKVNIVADEITRSIVVSVPRAEILSNELLENSMQVYVEEESLFSNLTLEDGSVLREEIKSKAVKNALDHGLLSQAQEQAADLIRSLIEAVPSVKETYSIVIRKG